MRVLATYISMAVWSLGAVLTQAQTTGLPIATRQSSFAIPFSVNASGKQPREVQLFVSTDQGPQWSKYASADPTAKEFLFRCAGDGEYWFAVRTIDDKGERHPSTPLVPQLKVLVDTAPPKLEFNAQVGAAGEIIATWRMIDDNLAVKSFRVEFQPIASQPMDKTPWQQVAIELPRDELIRNTFQGETTWLANVPTQGVRIRAVVRDRAGNVEEVNRRLFLPRFAKRPPVAEAPNDPEFIPPRDPFLARKTDETSAVDAPSSPDVVVPHYDPVTGELIEPQSRGDDGVKKDAMGTFARFRPDANDVETKPAEEPVTRPRKWSDMLPDGEQLRMTNARRLNLQYDVDVVGPSGVAKVELWVTKDGGRSWENWGEDKDRQSPFSVEVDGEGVFGFRIAITSGIGFASQPPRPGELADLWIGIDETKPTCEIRAVPFGTGQNAGQLIIQWKADDQHLRQHPITLKFATSPSGLWRTIATNLANTGQFNWRVDPSIGREVYILLEARDEAGNIGTYKTPRPVNIEGLRPRGRIKTFQPIGPQALQQPQGA